MDYVLTTPTRKRVLKLNQFSRSPRPGFGLNDTDPQEGTETELVAVDVVVTPGLNDTDPQEGTETTPTSSAVNHTWAS